MIKGALFDIDDTLFSHKIDAVPTLTLKALDKLREKDIKIGVCTSRLSAEISSFPKELIDRIDCFVIATGAVTIIKDQYFKAYSLKKEDVKDYIEYFKANNIPYNYSDVNGDLYYWGDESFLKDGKFFSRANNVMIKEYEDEEITSLYFCAHNEEEATYIRNIRNNNYISWWGTYGNIGPELVDKSFGLLKFCQAFSLTTDEVISFGDGGNDDTMLEIAGIGVAVKDANQKAIDAADYVCHKSIEDGGIYEALVDLKIIEEEKYTPKIFFFDNDSTLFSHSINEVPESTYLALEKLKAKGYRLCMNTSRSPEEMYNVPKRLTDLMDDINLLSGAYCISKDGVDVTYINHDDIKIAIKMCDEKNLTYRYVLGSGTGHLNRIDEYADIFKRLYDMVPTQKDYEGEEVAHLLFYANRETGEEIERSMHDASFAYLKRAIEVSAKNIDKGTTLERVAKKYGCDIKDTCAFGDSGNDINMLQKAGLGICMGNGSTVCKQAADYITDDIDEDGLYNALVHFKIIEE